MKTKLHYVFSLALILIGFSVFGQQNSSSIWSKITKNQASSDGLLFRNSEPVNAIYYELNVNALKDVLENAPKRKNNQISNTIVEFPNSDGSYSSFKVLEASVMHSDLQTLYKNIRSYVGQGVENPADLIRFSVTPQGLHTIKFSAHGGIEFIDPFSRTNNSYIAYKKGDLPMFNEGFECGFVNQIPDLEADYGNLSLRNSNDGNMRDYRLALASTIEYSEYHWLAAGLTMGDTEAAKKAAVLAEMVVLMTRVNGIYERDLSITMTLVANNEDIIFIDSDNFTNSSASALINESQAEIDAIIGNANYDIGHTASTGGGGLAGKGVVCTAGAKARGITGLANPVSDVYYVDFVSHEIGHQFDANHTFNGSTGNCTGGNRNASTAYEPGSGSTIMGYAGICSPQNVQSNSDAFFHQASLLEIWNYASLGGGNSCPTITATGNSAPTAEAGASYTIPLSTPYKLTGSSTDVNGTGTHTFTWEQYDLGSAGVPTVLTTTGPLVRSFEGTSNPTRFIPRLSDLPIGGGSISTNWEKLVSIARDINFQLTVRDNDSRGGQTATDNMTVTTTNLAGPFLVTSQNTNQIVWTPSTMETITWDVAGTTGNGINAANVDIMLSTDGGLTYDTILASNTPNDGSHDITVPIVEAPYCRIMVQGNGHIFFALNDYFLAIGNYTYQPGEVCTNYLFNGGIAVPENAGSYAGATLSVPDSGTITDLDINVNITHNDNADLFYAWVHPSQSSGFQALASGLCSGAADVDLTFDDEGSAINCLSANNGDNVLPEVAMSFADGLDSAGDWTFLITDVNVGDGNTAIWNSTTLTICVEGDLEPVLGIEEANDVNLFTVYPNPNNGEFSIQLNSVSSGKVKIEVFDVRGRLILNKSYNNSGGLNENINLGNVQSGMYLVKLTEGNRKSTKKIMVN